MLLRLFLWPQLAFIAFVNDAGKIAWGEWHFLPKAKMVPEGGFEPPTRGFSIRCSTPELLGLHGENRVGAQPIERRCAPWQAQNQSCSLLSKLSS
jgi:hypothetical protein